MREPLLGQLVGPVRDPEVPFDAGLGVADHGAEVAADRRLRRRVEVGLGGVRVETLLEVVHIKTSFKLKLDYSMGTQGTSLLFEAIIMQLLST